MVTTSLVNSLLFKPPPPKPYRFKNVIKLQTSNGNEIAAVYVKREGANVTILFSHGNAEDLNTSYWWLERLAKECNVNVLSYDYAGYGHCCKGA